MRANELPVLTLDHLLSRMWSRRWLVILCGALGVAFVLSSMLLSPKYQQDVELHPPSWEAIAKLNESGLVDFQRPLLYGQFFNHLTAKSTAKAAWGKVMNKPGSAQSTGNLLPVQVQVPGGLPKFDEVATPRVVVATGPAPEEVMTFLREVIKTAQARVLESAQEHLRGAIALHQSNTLREIDLIQTGNQQKIELQRHADRQAALQGGGHEAVPLAYMDLRELNAELARFEDFSLPADLAAAAVPNFEQLEPPRDWYSKWHLIAGFLVGLFIGSWLAVAWKPSSVS